MKILLLILLLPFYTCISAQVKKDSAVKTTYLTAFKSLDSLTQQESERFDKEDQQSGVTIFTEHRLDTLNKKQLKIADLSGIEVTPLDPDTKLPLKLAPLPKEDSVS